MDGCGKAAEKKGAHTGGEFLKRMREEGTGARGRNDKEEKVGDNQNRTTIGWKTESGCRAAVKHQLQINLPRLL